MNVTETVWFCDNCDQYTRWRAGIGCLECDSRDRAESERTRKILDRAETNGALTSGERDG